MMYLMLMADNIRAFIMVLTVIAWVVCIFSTLFCLIEEDFAMIKETKFYFVYIFTFFISALCCAVPTTKQFSVILVTPKIINNEQVQQIPEKIIKLADSWLEELEPKKE